MDTSVGQFNNLSTPVKVGIAVAGGAGLLGIIAALTGGDAKVLAIVAIGLVFVAFLLVVYKWVLGWFRKRKAAPLERGILNNSAASPNSISEPARRARLDDLRRSFEGGVEKFRASGKNIYSLPWYALVGEPGSGKTEAIRHCNVGFPPGLQDQLQGAGGTLNMNWWFTNHAIILDTAGRLMFEEVEPGATSEWKEFLGMLTRARPNCPINGMLLVIPADSLIRDTADAIERKAGKIAQQLDSIQRILGVRFPVFVVITKADLINGFREFFDDLKDPQLQHQILGWSNPNGLDQPFSPEQVERHLESVSASLCKRRQGLLIDPVNRDDPNGRRVDEVDALYSFPQSLLKIAPRLRRYLEMVFVAGEWSPKPLFLRGIYFTSSMREGSALDAELAEVLGVPMESLPEGKVFERDRAYFLRDLFINKVFKEKGLVTRASDTKKLQRQRKLAVLVSGFVAVFLLLGLTWYGKSTLDQQIGQQRAYWTTAHREYDDTTERPRWKVFSDSKPYSYLGGEIIRTESGRIPRGQFHAETYKALQNDIKVPWVFKPLVVFSGDPNAKRTEAYRILFERSVLSPLIKDARAKIHEEKPENWSDNATAALAQLIRIETYASKNTPIGNQTNPGDAIIDLDPLARYVLDKRDDYEAFHAKYGKDLQVSTEWLYAKPGAWPPAYIAADSQNNGLQIIAEGVDKFSKSWAGQIQNSPRITAIKTVVDSLDQFRKAEISINDNTKKLPETKKEYENVSGIWKEQYGILQKARGEADAAIELLNKNDGWPDIKTLGDLYQGEALRIGENAARAHQALINQLCDEKAPSTAALSAVRQTLKDAMAKVPALKDAAKTDQRWALIPDLDRFYLAKGQDLDKRVARRYVVHAQLYKLADDQMTSSVPAGDHKFNTIAVELAAIDKDILDQVKSRADAVPSSFKEDKDTINRACDSVRQVAEIAARFKRSELIKVTLTGPPNNADAVGAAVAAIPEPPVPYGKVPLTDFAAGGKFPAEVNPEAAKKYLTGWKSINELLPDPKAKTPARVLNAEEISTLYDTTRKPVDEYVKGYLSYWTSGLRDRLTVGQLTAWKELFNGNLAGNQWEVRALSAIQDIDEKARNAVTPILDLFPDQKKTFEPLPLLSKQQLGQCEGRYIRIVNAWRNLGQETEGARNGVLNLTPSAFESNYLFFADQNAALADQYIAGFSYQMLQVLANEVHKTALKAFEELKGLSRFPLAKPDKDTRILNANELVRARELIRQVIVPANNVNINAADRKIGDGGRIRDANINKLLDKLCGLSLDGADKTFMEQTAALLAALPADPNKPAKCVISALDIKHQEDYSRDAQKAQLKPYSTWPVITICQDARPQLKGFTDKKEPDPMGTVTYPGGPIQFRAVNHPANSMELNANPAPFAWPPAAANNQLGWGGQWGPVLLLLGQNGHRIGDGHEWHVEVPIDADTSLWVKLEFTDKDLAGFPPVTKWPEKK